MCCNSHFYLFFIVVSRKVVINYKHDLLLNIMNETSVNPEVEIFKELPKLQLICFVNFMKVLLQFIRIKYSIYNQCAV